ncbi:MAG: hypothetical protein Mars2KO_12580 [Maribacter sp.]
MKRTILYIGFVFLIQSCIPLRIAPTIEDYKLTRGKKFKRSLSKRHMFIFEDPKEAGHFYDYVNTKFDLNHEDVYDDVPFKIDSSTFFFAFYEVEIPDKTLSLGPLMLDLVLNAALDNEDPERYVSNESSDMIRRDNWYIAMEVYSDAEKDCLQEESLSKELVLKYLRALKNEYLSTHNYNETVFKN